MSIFQRTFSFLLLAMVFVGGFFVTPDFTPEVSNSVIAFDIGISEVSANTNTSPTTPAAADAKKTDNSTTDTINEWMATIAKIFNTLLGVVTVLVTPVIMFAGWLLSPDWITGKIFGLQEPMYKMWTTVANIVYFVYAILLIFVAIATIFNSQNYGYKALLPRLFLGIIMVPFTWLFVQFVISVSTIVTSAVMEIPYQTMKQVGATNSNQSDFWEKESIPKVIDVDTFFTASGELKQRCTKDSEVRCVSPSQLVDSAGGIYSPLLTYSYSIFKIQDLKTINTNWVDVIKNLGELVSGMLISTILFLVFGIIVIALVAMLFVRILMMWLYAMLSPLFTFKFVLADKWWKDAWWDLFEVQEFVGTAFIPAIVGLILSFGLIVAGTVQSGVTLDSKDVETCNVEQLKSEKWCKIMNIMGSPNNSWTYHVEDDKNDSKIDANGVVKTWATLKTVSSLNFGIKDNDDPTSSVRIKFYGSLNAGQKVSVDDVNILGTLGGIIVQFISIVFIWVAFVAIGRTSKIAGQIIRPFQDISGRLTKGAVQSMPLPLVGNISGISKVAGQIEMMAENNRHNAVAKSALGRATGIQYRDVKIEQSINAFIENPTKTANATARESAKDYPELKQRGDASARILSNAMHVAAKSGSESDFRVKMTHEYWVDPDDLRALWEIASKKDANGNPISVEEIKKLITQKFGYGGLDKYLNGQSMVGSLIGRVENSDNNNTGNASSSGSNAGTGNSSGGTNSPQQNPTPPANGQNS